MIGELAPIGYIVPVKEDRDGGKRDREAEKDHTISPQVSPGADEEGVHKRQTCHNDQYERRTAIRPFRTRIVNAMNPCRAPDEHVKYPVVPRSNGKDEPVVRHEKK